MQFNMLLHANPPMFANASITMSDKFREIGGVTVQCIYKSNKFKKIDIKSSKKSSQKRYFGKMFLISILKPQWDSLSEAASVRQSK